MHRIYNLGMLIESILMLSTTFFVKLKMESLSGFTDLVVSMTNIRGGLRTFPLELGSSDPDPDCGHNAHWQFPRHLKLKYSTIHHKNRIRYGDFVATIGVNKTPNLHVLFYLCNFLVCCWPYKWFTFHPVHKSHQHLESLGHIGIQGQVGVYTCNPGQQNIVNYF